VRYSALLKRAQYLKQSMLLLTLTSPIVTETSLCIQKSRFSIIPMEWGVKQQGIDYSTSQWGATAERIPVNWWVRLFYTWSQRNMKIEISKKVALGKKKIYNIVFLNFDLRFYFTGTEFLYDYNANLSKAVAAKRLPLTILWLFFS